MQTQQVINEKVWSVLCGFILAIIINLMLPTKIDYHGPDSNIIRKLNYISPTDETDCYKMEPYLVECP